MCTSCYSKKPCVKSNFADELPARSPLIFNIWILELIFEYLILQYLNFWDR